MYEINDLDFLVKNPVVFCFFYYFITLFGMSYIVKDFHQSLFVWVMVLYKKCIFSFLLYFYGWTMQLIRYGTVWYAIGHLILCRWFVFFQSHWRFTWCLIAQNCYWNLLEVEVFLYEWINEYSGSFFPNFQ